MTTPIEQVATHNLFLSVGLFAPRKPVLTRITAVRGLLRRCSLPY